MRNDCNVTNIRHRLGTKLFACSSVLQPRSRPMRNKTSTVSPISTLRNAAASAPSTQRPQGRRSMACVISAISVLAALGCEESKAKPGPPPPPHVSVAAVARRDVTLFIEAVGSLDGYVNAEIRARVRGFLQAQRYKDGATVKARAAALHHRSRRSFATPSTPPRRPWRAPRPRRAQQGAARPPRRISAPPSVVSQQELEDAEAAAARRRGSGAGGARRSCSRRS